MDNALELKETNVENRKQPMTKQRNYSLDLLRAISVLMIVFLHICSHGGLDAFYSPSSINGIILKLLNTLSMVAVNVFVLITGYYLVNGRFRLSKLIKICVECLFYNLLIFVFLLIKGVSLNVVDYLSLFLPISYYSYWFVSAYVGLYLLHPFLNILINRMTKKEHLFLLLILFLMYSLLRDILIKSEPFAVEHGYSLIWFIVLYFVAAYLRKHVNVKRVKCPSLLYFVSAFLAFCSWLVLSLLSSKFSFISSYGLADYWIRYNSVLILAGSIFLFIAFAKKEYEKNRFLSLISFVSSLSLGIYLIHDNKFFRDYLWLSIFRTNILTNDVTLIPLTLLVVFSIFIICIIVDSIRFGIFSLIYNRKWFTNLMNKIDTIPNVFLKASNSCEQKE